MKLSLVVPCYNEGQNVRPFFDACQTALGGTIDSYEVIFINDGSKDDTWAQLKSIARENRNVQLLNFSRNFGKEAAMYAGLQKAAGEYVTIIDADLQQRPELVVDMVRFLDDNPDYDSVAMFQKDRNEGKVLSFFKRSFYRLINSMCEIDFRAGASDFRTFRHYVVDAVLEMKEYFRFSKGIFSWVGFNTHYMPYNAELRQAGTSSWSFKKLFRYAIEGIVAFTTYPLKLSTYIGSICSVLSLLYMLFVIVQKLFFGIDIPGYATLLVLVLFLGGIQLVALGVIGTYISKIYIEGKKRPIYLLKEYINTKEDTDETTNGTDR